MRLVSTSSLLLVLGLTAPARGAVLVHQGNDATRWDVHVEGLRETAAEVEGEAFVKLELLGVAGYEAKLWDVGRPELPAVRLVVRGEGAIKVEVGPEAFGARALSAPVQPSLEAVPRVPGARRALPALQDLDETSPYPAVRYTVEEMGSERGERVRLVSLHPVQLIPGESAPRLVERFSVVHEGAPRADETQGLREGVAFVVGEEFAASPSLARYVAFQESLGFDVDVIVIEPATRSPMAIRSRLRDLYRSRQGSLRHVLIVGDNEHVPGIASTRVIGVTDHLYRTLDVEDYESDIGTPDVSLGRWAVGSEADIASAVEKSIRYVEGRYADPSWLDRASLIASDDTAWVHVAEGTLNDLARQYTTPYGYTGSFPTAALRGGDRLYAITHRATGADVLAKLQEGRGFVTYGGHGSETDWLGPVVTAADVATLRHPEATPFVSSHACYNGYFLVDSFGEAWLRHRHGAVAIWASMDLDFWDEGDVLQRLYYDAIFQHKVKHFGNVNDRTVRDFWRVYGGAGKSKYYWESYVTFGDPTISFRWKAPIEGKLERLDQTTLRVTDAAGRPLEGARVAVTTGDGSYRRVHYADAQGKVTLDVSQLTAQTSKLRVVATGRDLKLLQQEIALR